MALVTEKPTVKRTPGIWNLVGPVSDCWCQDCGKPTNECQELTRDGHWIYCCPGCAKVRTAAPSIHRPKASK
jgi:hypothetical protein